MTDLSDFGAGVEGSDDEPESVFDEHNSTGSGRTYRNGRCPAISVSTRERCKSPTSQMMADKPFCATHGRQHDPWTIHDDPETLILLTGAPYATSLSDLDPDDVDFDLQAIRDAVAAVDGGDGDGA